MPARLCCRAVPRPRARGGNAGDEGFTLVEVIVSITLMAIIMTALTTFFVSTGSAIRQQGGRQIAAQLAQDALETVRTLKGADVITGRSKCDALTNKVCAAPAAGVASYLQDVEEWDYPSGTPLTLNITPQHETRNGVDYAQNWYVGRCWQPAAGGSCQVMDQQQQQANPPPVLYYRVIVAVGWRDRLCTANSCSFVTSTLINSAADSPEFNANQQAQPPTVTNPGNQTDEQTLPVNLAVTETGGAPPIAWSASGLPPGLSIGPTGVVGGTPTTIGTYPVTIFATDGFQLVGSAAFTWTIVPVLTVTTPPAQSGETSATVNLPVSSANGIGPYSWSATGLPPGLSINSTGTITGTLTTTGSYSVVVTVADAKGKRVSTNPFAWTVTAGPKITPITVPAYGNNQPVDVTFTATSGTTPYKWTALNLPPGLSIDQTTGHVTGKPGDATRYLATITVSDAKGGTNSFVAIWNITAGAGWLQVISPTTDRTDTAGKALSFTATAGGGYLPYSWSATGLPHGVSITSGGVVSGTPDTRGSYTVKLTVTDGQQEHAVFMFVWTIQ
jgi:prepilin-type N-terminal cleavage/methylation domain-containing protein